MGFTRHAGILVPPKFTAGGSYPMLNYAVSSLHKIGDWFIRGEQPSYSYFFGGFSALPRAHLWSHHSLLDGYYLLLNPIVVYYDGSYPMLNYAVTRCP